MATFDVFFKAADRTVYIRPDGDAAPAGSVSIGTFDHQAADGVDDAQDQINPLNDGHVAFHHVRDLLFEVDEFDMQSISIVYLASSISSYPATKTLDISAGDTLQIVTEFAPDNASGRTLTYASSDATKATVSAGGLVTPVAAGTTTITVTNTESGKTDTVDITVQA